MNTQNIESMSKEFATLDAFVLNTPLAQVPTDFEQRLQTTLEDVQPLPETWYSRLLGILYWTVASGGLVLAVVHLLRFILGVWLITHLAY